MKNVIFAKSTAFALLILAVFCVIPASAQNPSPDVIMVLPFENTSNKPEYNWVGESFADALADLLNKPGLVVVSSDERELAYQQYDYQKPSSRPALRQSNLLARPKPP